MELLRLENIFEWFEYKKNNWYIERFSSVYRHGGKGVSMFTELVARDQWRGCCEQLAALFSGVFASRWHGSWLGVLEFPSWPTSL